MGLLWFILGAIAGIVVTLIDVRRKARAALVPLMVGNQLIWLPMAVHLDLIRRQASGEDLEKTLTESLKDIKGL